MVVYWCQFLGLKCKYIYNTKSFSFLSYVAIEVVPFAWMVVLNKIINFTLLSLWTRNFKSELRNTFLVMELYVVIVATLIRVAAAVVPSRELWAVQVFMTMFSERCCYTSTFTMFSTLVTYSYLFDDLRDRVDLHTGFFLWGPRFDPAGSI